ncbi:CU044_2847 family protein [Phytohabitans kaempferiae]|uniref:CU044_2847 family protein n=1 Tax=Phytohabitans kaempferiae TaxID=1620943 RepID=A0ABV6M1S6_9ACTN
MGDLLRLKAERGEAPVRARASTDLQWVGLVDRIQPEKQLLVEAFVEIGPAARAAVAAVQDLNSASDDVALKMGFTLTAETCAVVVHRASGGRITVEIGCRPRRARGQSALTVTIPPI